MKKIYSLLLISVFCAIFSFSSQAQSRNKFAKSKPNKSNFRTADSIFYVANSCLIKVTKSAKVEFKDSGIEMFKKNIPQGITFVSLDRLFSGSNDSKGDFDRELYYLLKFESQLNLEEVLLKINSLPFIEIAEPCKKIENFSMTPNDPYVDTTITPMPSQWSVKKVNAYKAWEIEKGDTNVVTGISDLGVEYSHFDLISNHKLNTADPIDGVDNDTDGYIDNYYGWDFGNNDNLPNPDGLASDLQHGTKVAGCGFMTPDNGKGGVGTGYNCKFVPIKVSDSFGSIVAGYQSIDYAVLKKMKVLNLSWGSQGSYSQIEQDVINNAVNNDVLIVAAGGNVIADAIYYPAGYSNVLAVAGTDINDTLCTTRSNIIDICFPGNGVVAPTRSDAFVFTSGSSFASPGVAGAAALVRSHFPSYNCLQVAELLRVTSDIIDTIPANQKYKGKIGYGRMNMYRALTDVNAISVRSTQNKAEGSLGNIIFVNDTATLVSRFVNFLAPCSNVVVKLTSKSPYVTIIDSVFNIASLGTLDSLKNVSTPFSFILKNGAPFNLSVDFTYMFDYGKGFIDYQNFSLGGLNPNFIDLDSNAITASITNNGRIGFVTPGVDGGNGFTYRGYNLQYQMGIMMSTHKNKLSNCLIGIDGQTCDNDFSPLLNTRYANVSFANQYITNTLVENNSNKLGVQVTQRSYEMKASPLNKTVFFEYRIKNTNSTVLDSLNFSLYTDWDIPTIGTTDPNYYVYNRCVWDASKKMSYNYNLFINTVLAGTALLTDDKPLFYALDNAYNPTNLYNGFSDTEKYLISSNGTAKNKSGFLQTTGGDVSENIGYTLFNIAPGETRIVAFAVMAGDNLLELQNAALAAQTTFRQMKTSPAPILALNNNICKNTSIVINPTSVDSIAISKQVGGTVLYKGFNFVSGLLKKDTTFYVQGLDSLFASASVTTNYLIQKPSAAFVSSPSASVDRQVDFAPSTTAGISTWAWDFGDNTSDNVANTSHVYSADGDYLVKLIATDALGCSDTTANHVIASVVTSIEKQQVDKPLLQLFPNPVKNTLYLKHTGTVDVAILDVLGREVAHFAVLGVDDDSIVSSISIDELSAGTYIVIAISGNRQELTKLIVTH